MPTSGELGFAPVLHNITAEQVMFVYNSNNSGSLEVAEYYRDQRKLPADNLIGLNLPTPVLGATSSDSESILLNEADYLYLIENPLIASLSNIGTTFTTDGLRSIWVIILGFGIPLTYSDDGELIAIASRLHRLGQPISHKNKNHTFDRRGEFKFFDSNDASKLFITAVLDGPSVSSVKKLIDRAIDVDNQTFVTGDIFVDPYGRKTTSEDLSYQQDISDFIEKESPHLGLQAQVTVDLDDPYLEPTVASLKNDSFCWGWFNPTFSQQLLLNQNERRVFLYNADDCSADNIHFSQNGSAFDINGSDHWCNIAINAEPGYACCAGAISEPGSDAFLKPIPFFQALHQGATIGEAFLFASEFVSWKTVFIGDPLMTVNFPDDLPEIQNTSITTLPNDEIILKTKEFIEESLGWATRQTRLTQDILNKVVESIDLTEGVNLLVPFVSWNESKGTRSQTDIYLSIVTSWLEYIQKTTNLTLPEWLANNNQKVTTRLNDIIAQTGSPIIDSSFIYPIGYWEFTFQFIHDDLTLEDIFFRIDIADTTTFNPLFVKVNSLQDVTGWQYESDSFSFVQMPITGFPSNFSGNRIKFKSPVVNFLRSTETYWLRWTAINSSGVAFPGKTATQQIIISS